MMNLNIKNHKVAIITNASLSEIESKYDNIDYHFEKFYCIIVQDINDNLLTKKAIGYDDQEPTFCFSESIDGFQIINGKLIHILEFNGKEIKLEFTLPVIKVFYYDKDLIVIYEIGISRVSYETKEVVFNEEFSDIINDFDISLIKGVINFNLYDDTSKIINFKTN